MALKLTRLATFVHICGKLCTNWRILWKGLQGEWEAGTTRLKRLG